MFSLAAIRYRSVLAADGGPVECIEEGELTVFGKKLRQANARLSKNLVPRHEMQIFSNADGTGMHPSPMIARHMAVSEALERWAYHDSMRSSKRALFSFDVDGSSNGMAAFPGLFVQMARRRAFFEAAERFCLLNWWERRLDGEICDTRWPGSGRSRSSLQLAEQQSFSLCGPIGVSMLMAMPLVVRLKKLVNSGNRTRPP